MLIANEAYYLAKARFYVTDIFASLKHAPLHVEMPRYLANGIITLELTNDSRV